MNMHENVKSKNIPFRKHFMLWIAQEKHSDIALQESLHVISSYQEQMPRICRWRPWKKRQKRRIIFVEAPETTCHSLQSKDYITKEALTFSLVYVFSQNITAVSLVRPTCVSVNACDAFLAPRLLYGVAPYAHVRTAYGRRKEEKEEEGKGFFLGGRERDSSESRFDHGWGFPDASLRCAVNQVVADEKRRKICVDWYFWHFHFQHA